MISKQGITQNRSQGVAEIGLPYRVVAVLARGLLGTRRHAIFHVVVDAEEVQWSTTEELARDLPQRVDLLAGS